MAYLKILPVGLSIQHKMMEKSVNNWERLGRKWLRPNLTYYPAFAWSDCKKPEKDTRKSRNSLEMKNSEIVLYFLMFHSAFHLYLRFYKLYLVS
jgi:hypothetical protein